jgi:Icc-related predicted phosphoesterase
VTGTRWHKFRDGRTVDILLTHAPPLGVGDGHDVVHRGFAAHLDLIERLRPPLLLHGHVEPGATYHELGGTVVRNVVGRHVVEVEPQRSHQRRAS